MANINAILNNASIQVLDTTTNAFRVNSAVGTVTLTANSAFYDAYFLCATGGGSVLTLPNATIWACYVKNLSGSVTVTVQLTVTGGVQISATNSPILLPGGVFMYFLPSETAAGLTGVTLIGGAASAYAEVLLAA